MEKANERCAKIKQVYENCFRTWYSGEFLKGNAVPSCQDEFVEYKECVVAVMQGATTVDLSSVDCNPETVLGSTQSESR